MKESGTNEKRMEKEMEYEHLLAGIIGVLAGK